MAKTAVRPAPSGQPSSESSSRGKRPVHEIRYRTLAAAIWKNTGEDGQPFYSVTVKKGWQDEQQAWHDTTSFNFSDLPTLAKTITNAHTWIAAAIKRDKAEAAKDVSQ